MRHFVGSFVLCFAFGLSLDLVAWYADWSHTFWSCNLGRNVVIGFVMAYSSLLREKKRCDFVTLRSRRRYIQESYGRWKF